MLNRFVQNIERKKQINNYISLTPQDRWPLEEIKKEQDQHKDFSKVWCLRFLRKHLLPSSAPGTPPAVDPKKLFFHTFQQLPHGNWQQVFF